MLSATSLVTRWALARQSSSPALCSQRKLLCLAYELCSPPDISFAARRTFSSSPVNATPSPSALSSSPSPSSFPSSPFPSPSSCSSSSSTTRSQTDSTPVLALVFDTETTGKVNFDRVATDAIQPDLVQLGFLLVDTSSWIPRTKASLLLQLREGVRIESGAQRVHGVSAEDCLRFGVAADTAASLFLDACRRADVLVAHNVRFDAVVMEAALSRSSSLSSSLSSSDISGIISSKRQVCTMQETTHLCRLPAKFGGQYKWPSLSEAYAFATEGEELQGGHDAMVDAQACLKVFRFLVEEGHVMLEDRASTESTEERWSNDKYVDILVEPLDVVAPQTLSSRKMETSEHPPMNFSVRGNTFAHKDTLRELGGKWNSVSKEWLFSDSSIISELKVYQDLIVIQK